MEKDLNFSAMKKLIASILLSVATIVLSFAQLPDLGTAVQAPMQADSVDRYRLYPTKNFWIFIKLDTQTGRMWLVQFSIDDEEKRGEAVLSSINLASSLFSGDILSDSTEVNGRFELYPTQNTFNFILLDQLRGRAYQVQWSFDEYNRFVIPIL